MKILNIHLVYPPAFRYGGPIKSVHDLNKWLVKKGAEVTVYTTNIDGKYNLNVPTCVPVEIDGVKVFYFSISCLRSWFYSWEFHRALARHTKDFDIIYIVSVFTAASTLGAYYGKKFNVPYIISPRGTLMQSPLGKKSLKKIIYNALIEKRNLRDAAAIHFTAETEKEEYLKAGFPLKKAIMIPNGLDLEEFQSCEIKFRKIGFRKKFGINKNEKVILFLSRLNWKKGLDTLIPAFAEVVKKNPKTILVLAGPDDEGYGESLKPQISNLRINGKVIFTGMLLGDDKIAAYQESDVFVLPSYSENFGIAVLEAMYFGLPTIISENVGIASNIKRAGAGLIIRKNKKESVEAILRVFSNRALANNLSRKGKLLVEKEFFLSPIADRFIKECQAIIK